MAESAWDTTWGEPEDYNVVLDCREHEGITVEDKVECLEDYTEDAQSAYEADQGTVIGICFTPAGEFHPSDRWEVLVSFDDRDPQALPAQVLRVVAI